MIELSLFQLWNQTFVLILGEFTSVIIKDGLRGFRRGGVKENDRRHVLPEGSCDAGYLLGERPNADANMASRKAEIYQRACAPFHIFRGGAVIEDYERVGALKKPGHELQPIFHLVLRAYYHKHSWIIFTSSVVGLVVRECQADEHDVVELAAERAIDLVRHKPWFAWVCQADNESVER